MSNDVNTRKMGGDNGRTEAVLLPSVDVIDDTAGITLYVDLPGVPKERLHLQVEAGNLTIEGELALGTPQGLGGRHVEVPRYRRAFALSKELDSDKIAAEFSNGVLKLRIPKAAHAQLRKVDIKVQ